MKTIHTREQKQESEKRALVIRQGSLGDICLTGPVFAAFRSAGYQVTVAGRREYCEVLRQIGLIADILPLDRPPLADLFCEASAATPGGAPLSADTIHLLTSFDTIVSYTEREEPFTRNLLRSSHRNIIIHPVSAEDITCHISDELLKPVRALLPGPSPAIRQATQTGRATSTVVLHPGSGSPAKNWPIENFLHLFQHLINTRKTSVLLGPAEEDQYAFWSERIPKDSLFVSDSLADTRSLLDQTGCFIGNDSGVTHLAALMGVTTVALFGPTSPALWAPRGPHVTILYHPVACSPCSRDRRNRCTDRKCLTGITPVEIQKSE